MGPCHLRERPLAVDWVGPALATVHIREVSSLLPPSLSLFPLPHQMIKQIDNNGSPSNIVQYSEVWQFLTKHKEREREVADGNAAGACRRTQNLLPGTQEPQSVTPCKSWSLTPQCSTGLCFCFHGPDWDSNLHDCFSTSESFHLIILL